MEEIVVVANPIIEGNQVDRFGASSTVVTRNRWMTSTPWTWARPSAARRA
jgi:hypothetical protein